jgi:hypothetical protein
MNVTDNESEMSCFGQWAPEIVPVSEHTKLVPETFPSASIKLWDQSATRMIRHIIIGPKLGSMRPVGAKQSEGVRCDVSSNTPEEEEAMHFEPNGFACRVRRCGG